MRLLNRASLPKRAENSNWAPHGASAWAACFATVLWGMAAAGTTFGSTQEPTVQKEPVDVNSPAWTALVNEWVQPLIDDGQVVGLTVGVLQGDNRWAMGYGLVAKEIDVKPDFMTTYEIGSISKVFTGLLLADAVVNGKVELNDPVQTLMPAGVMLKDREAPVTLEHLANHTSGWKRMPNNLRPKDFRNPYKDYRSEHLFAYLGQYRPKFAPGEDFEYSNLAVGTLGLLLAKQQGTSYENLLKSRIANPLGLGNTSVTLPKMAPGKRAAPYNVDLERTLPWSIPTLTGAGGIRSTVMDLMTFSGAVLQAPGGPLGKAIELSMQETHRENQNLAVGLGWHIRPRQGVYWHNGQTGGFHGFLAIHPEEKLSVIILSNTACSLVDQLGNNLMRELRGYPTLEWRYQVSVELLESELQSYVGTYQMTEEVFMEVTLGKSGLSVQMTGQGKLRMHASESGEFFLRAVEASITFNKDEAGGVTGLTLHQNGNHTPAVRLSAAQ